MRIDYRHRFSAHCETGTIAGLLQHAGIQVDEPMIFGVGSGLFFAYFPFIKVAWLPLLVYRTKPGSIFKHLTRRLGLDLHSKRFRDPKRAMGELDALLERGLPVGLQVGVFWLPYMTEAQRVHFNTHNVIVVGKEGSDYVLSDSLMLDVVTCPAEALARARFAKGMMEPDGLMYHVEPGARAVPDLKGPVREGIVDVCKAMTGSFIPMVGVRGIRYLAKSVEKWPRKLDEKTVLLRLGDIVVLQELAGTGGGGFRFLYAAFLKEAGEQTGNAKLTGLSKPMLEVGEQWREFASIAARLRGHRPKPGESFQSLPDLLRDIAAREESLYAELRKAVA